MTSLKRTGLLKFTICMSRSFSKPPSSSIIILWRLLLQHPITSHAIFSSKQLHTMKISTLAFLLLASSNPTTDAFAPAAGGSAPFSALHLTREEDLKLTRELIMANIGGESSPEAAAESEPTSVEIKYTNPAPPANDLMIRAALRRDPVERTPVWPFRQAGRHLPEYHAHKEKTGRSFLDMLKFPEDVAECTLQPCRRYYPMDAATPAFIEDKMGVILDSVKLIRKKMSEEDISIPLIGFSGAPFTLMLYMIG